MHYFKMKEPAVASETIEGEVVVINLETGNYFSLRKEAAEVWEMMENGWSAEAVAAALQRRYSTAEAEIDAAIQTFFETLVEEGLVVSVEGPDVPAFAIEQAVLSERPAFIPPVLNKYTDMQELLFLDPIHEVDESGWPNLKASPNKDAIATPGT